MLVPESAHGTNPATAAACGFAVDPIPANARGRVDLAALKAKLGPDVAAIMLTNPNTCGLFEDEIVADRRGDRMRPGRISIATAPISTPSSAACGRAISASTACISICTRPSRRRMAAAGPGAGPVVLAESLAPFAPLPWVVHDEKGFAPASKKRRGAAAQALGRLKGFHGQMGMFVRALAYMMSHGADGLRQVSGDAVLNANYLLARLERRADAVLSGPLHA